MAPTSTTRSPTSPSSAASSRAWVTSTSASSRSRGYPNATTPGLADPLLRLPFPYRWSLRFLPFSPATAAKVIGKAQLGWFQKRRGAGDWVKDMASKEKRQDTEMDLAFQDANASQMVLDAGAARASNTGGDLRFGYLTACAVVMADSGRAANDRAAGLLKAVRDLGFTGRVEDVKRRRCAHRLSAGPRPRQPPPPRLVDRQPRRSPPAHSPVGRAPRGAERALPRGLAAAPVGQDRREHTPFRLCLHEGDVGHTLIVGATGAGKSVLVGLLLAQWRRYAGARTVTFDVGYSHYVSGPRDGRGALRPRRASGGGPPRRDAAAPRCGPARGANVGRRLGRVARRAPGRAALARRARPTGARRRPAGGEPARGTGR